MPDHTLQLGWGRVEPHPRSDGDGPQSDRAVLHTVFMHGPLTRPEIAARTGLSKPTVSEAIRRLEDVGLVRQSGERRGAIGRVPITYEVHAPVGAVAAVDVGGSNIRVAVADVVGDIIAEHREPTDPGGGRLVLEQVIGLLRRVIDSARPEVATTLLTCGISTPGIVGLSGTTVRYAYNIEGWDELPVADAVQQALGVDVIIENNVNAAALGERWLGVMRDVETACYVAVGAGVGMGLIVNGELFRGARGAAGEIAYLPLAADPFDPAHRRRGALEDMASASGIVDRAASHSRWSGPRPSSAEEVFQRAAAGDAAAGEVIEHEVRSLALAIASICSIVDPEVVVLGGGVGSSPQLLDAVSGHVHELLPFAPRIMATALGERAALHGAVALALDPAHEMLAGRASARRV